MTITADSLITYALVIMAFLFLAARFYRTFYVRGRGAGKGCGSCGCKKN